MLARKYRLTKQKDFGRLQARGQSVANRFFKLIYSTNKLVPSRLAVVVSTRLSKKATQRNRLRRQCQEIIRLHWPRIKTGYDLLLRPKYQALGQDYLALEKAILALLVQARLL